MPQSENWPFRRLFVDHLFHGTSRVWWDMEAGFNDPQPWTFQLQAGYTGNSNALDWTDIGDPAVNAYFLDDDSGMRETGKRLLTHYRIVLVTPRGNYASNPQGLWGTLSAKDWNFAKELIRKERLQIGEVGVPGYFIRRMRYGKLNPASTDFLTHEVTDSAYPGTWGTAFKVGYHPPVNVEIIFNEEHVNEFRGGDNISRHNSRPTEFPARVIAFPDVAKEDVWVDARTDQRWTVHGIKVAASWRGVPLVYSVNLRLVPYTDIIYKIPVSPLSYDLTDTEKFQPLQGTGCVRVDHDYGEDSALVYQTGDCCGISGATILAFKKADWDAGLRTPEHAAASSQTTANGTWAWAMMLNPGDYMLWFEKPGEYGPDIVPLTVYPPDPAVVPPTSSSSFSESFGGF